MMDCLVPGHSPSRGVSPSTQPVPLPPGPGHIPQPHFPSSPPPHPPSLSPHPQPGLVPNWTPKTGLLFLTRKFLPPHSTPLSPKLQSLQTKLTPHASPQVPPPSRDDPLLPGLPPTPQPDPPNSRRPSPREGHLTPQLGHFHSQRRLTPQPIPRHRRIPPSLPVHPYSGMTPSPCQGQDGLDLVTMATAARWGSHAVCEHTALCPVSKAPGSSAGKYQFPPGRPAYPGPYLSKQLRVVLGCTLLTSGPWVV
uniref:Proline-rich receptor-like protein kinase PERK2 n=1 Tax=Camelus bactrianus TaxID=9837 RepID=A0A9W3F1V3_CAMBA|nr:proline-rich receptor-like protein kinase PERK2 [Camelus bactrianus]